MQLELEGVLRGCGVGNGGAEGSVGGPLKNTGFGFYLE